MVGLPPNHKDQIVQERESRPPSTESSQTTNDSVDNNLQGSPEDVADEPTMGGDGSSDFNVDTMKSFEDAIKDLTDQSYEESISWSS